ncbi:MarR family transcriptional regulator [Azospirillum sp. SYSU D00513]|uniref:HVO_A0114 family putative DNA-binding protein n=1 Tax=Azospirillum sp. SYSU D00513 TaxID=2812561 RepID=UPI001A965386|nr:MarR family transcriptional regulator [Azospirillum sp. SYSU D00513]
MESRLKELRITVGKGAPEEETGPTPPALQGETVPQPEETVGAGSPIAVADRAIADWDTLARTLTGRRLDLLRHLRRHPAASVRALAAALGRDYSNVHADVRLLAEAGLIARGADGGLRVEHDAIQLRIAL